MRLYEETIDKLIIEILYTSNKLAFGKLEEILKSQLDHFSYKTYAGRLNAMSNSEEDKNSRYAIQPVLDKRDEGRGKNTFYSLTKNARIRCDLKLPILKSETLIEKAYIILFRYLAFENFLPYRRLKDENDYNSFLKKLSINKNELQLDGKPSYNRNLYKVSKWIHQQSEIKISQREYLEESDDNHENSEYYYQLPGISIKEFIANKESAGLAYGHLDFKNEVNEYFKLLEDQKIIEKIKSKYLIILNEVDDRYNIISIKGNKLKKFLKDCWLLHGSVTLYLYQKWKCIQRPTEEEKIWYEHLWGRQRSNQIFTDCDKERVKLNKSKNQKYKQDKEDIQKLLNQIIKSLQKKYETIKNKYPDIIAEDYSYLANPLLNLVYPQFLRQKE